MAILAPFKGLTYNFKLFQDISKLVAPPYDVIPEKEQDRYYQIDPHNVIRLILGKKKIGDSDWDNRYTRAADFLKRWESENVLVRSNYPSIYLTSLTYDPGDGTKRVRWGLIALVRIEDDGSGVILPHERTFSAHKDDRLKLMRACHAQLSQVFGLYDDPEDLILSTIKNTNRGFPQASFYFKDNTKHEIWEINHHSVSSKIANTIRNKSIFIADGHHRYETARNYRNIMRTRYGRLPENRSYEFIMMYLTNMNDEGLTILPSHRLIKKCRRFDPNAFLSNIKQWFEVDERSFPESNQHNEMMNLKQALEEKGRTSSVIGFYYYKSNKYYLLSLKPEARDAMGVGLAPSLKKLDVLVLSRLILQKSLGFTKEDLDNEEIFHYTSNMKEAISYIDSGTFEMTFLLNPTKIDHVKEIASNGLIMPRKSTFFYPKVLTGLVFNKIDPNEIIQVF